MDKPNGFWRKVLWSDETKIELFFQMTRGMFGRVKVRLSCLITLYQLSGMVVVASCSGAVLLQMILVHYTKWIE